jgi:hypothetical protein
MDFFQVVIDARAADRSRLDAARSFVPWAGSFSEKSRHHRRGPRRQDADGRGLRGRHCVAYITQVRDDGRASAPRSSLPSCWRWCTASPAITHRGSQVVSGVAINILVAMGLTVVLGDGVVRARRADPRRHWPERPLRHDQLPSSADAVREVRSIVQVYVALLSVPFAWPS